jgi:hypothetical protein
MLEIMFGKVGKLNFPLRVVWVIDIAFAVWLIIAGCSSILSVEGDFWLGIILAAIGLWIVIGEIRLRSSFFQIVSLLYVLMAVAVAIDMWMPSPEASWYLTPTLAVPIITLLLVLAVGSSYMAGNLLSQDKATAMQPPKKRPKNSLGDKN